MDQTRRGFLAAVGAAATAGCVAPVGGQASGEQVFQELYDAVAPSVARVRAYLNGPIGEGSAFFHDESHLVTNDHVLGRGETFRVQFADGEWAEVDVVGRDPYSDLAVLSVDDAREAEPLTFREGVPKIGEEVLVVGSPLGFEGSASQGIVSGVNRTIPAPNNFSIADAVQTDAALNPGNSGGPIVDLDGTVVAVATATRGENLGFGVSARLANRVVPALVETGEYNHSYMGVRVVGVTPLLAQANDLPEVRGVYVAETVPDEPADGVLEGSMETESVEGTQVPVGGDVIVRMGETEIRTQEDLSRFLALRTAPEDTIELGIVRDGAEETVELTLGSRPNPRG